MKRFFHSPGMAALMATAVACGEAESPEMQSQTSSSSGPMTNGTVDPLGTGTGTGTDTGTSQVGPVTTPGDSPSQVSTPDDSMMVGGSTTMPPQGPGNDPSNQPVAVSPSPIDDPTGMPPNGPVPVSPEPNTDPQEPGMMPADPEPVATGDCSFTVEHSLSDAIGTVGIVTFTSTATLTDAEIQFGLVGGNTKLTAPVNLDAPDHRTLLLGMKGSSEYSFQIVANGGSCVSETFTLETDPVPNAVPQVQADVTNPAAASKGFIITTAGVGSMGGFPGAGGGGGDSPMLIFDTDGDIVWWADAPPNASRALMDWAGENVYVSALNYPQGAGQMRRVSMDGMETETVAALANVHHDFTVTPDGVTAIVYEGGCSAIVEYSPGGGVKPVVNSIETLYQPGGGFMGGGFECHPNAITYQPADDTYIVGDRNPNLFVRITRDGQLLWQFGGSEPKGNFMSGSWMVNHGHHMLENGNFLFFNNGNGNPSPVYEYSLDTGNWTATEVWNFTQNGSGSAVLGDVQRLANGNTLITYSNGGTILEVDPQKNVVARFTTGSMGYSLFRESLYGPPPK